MPNHLTHIQNTRTNVRFFPLHVSALGANPERGGPTSPRPSRPLLPLLARLPLLPYRPGRPFGRRREEAAAKPDTSLPSRKAAEAGTASERVTLGLCWAIFAIYWAAFITRTINLYGG